MNTHAWVGEISAPLAVAVGLLACFLGYRLLKLTLGLMGFIAGAAAGWAVGSSLEPGNSGITLVFAFIGAVIGAVLYVWLLYLGIFLLGASAGLVVAAVFFNLAGYPPSMSFLLASAAIFGILALVARKFMLVTSTAVTGSYLTVAAIFELVPSLQNHSPLWFTQAPPSQTHAWGYVALLLWGLLALAGARFQNRAHRTKDQPTRQPGPEA
jgi:hypothetical protein